MLGVPARSASYAPEPAPTDPAGEKVAGDTDGTHPDPGAETSADSAVSADEGSAGGELGGSQRDRTSDEESESGSAEPQSRSGIVVAGVLVVMILAVTGGVVYAAEVAPDGDAGAFAAPVPADGGTLSDAEVRRDSRDLFNENGAVATPTATPSESSGSGARTTANDTEADRNVRPAPTCERSFLNVVQVQLNALKYNNNTTDDGIRTVRRFSSPRNRQTIRTFDEFARIIKNPTYRPMLSYESAQFNPIQASDDYAQVQVLTREDGNVTGQYYFRLRKIDGGEYDGCWMTDAVVAVPETTDFSGRVGGQSTTDSNETS